MTLKQAIAILVATGTIGTGIYEGTVEDTAPDFVLPGEKVAARTLVSKTVDMGNGRGIGIIYSRPIHYEDPVDSSLKTIDTGFHERPLLTAIFSEYEIKVNAGNYVAYFDKDSYGRYRAESPDGSRWIEFDPLFNESADLTVDIETEWNGVKETITLLNDKSPTTLKWLVKNEGITANAPTATDAKLVPVPVTEKASGDTLIYMVDITKAVYPIIIDPSVVIDTTSVSNRSGSLYTAQKPTYTSARDTVSANSFPTGSAYIGQYYDASPRYDVYRVLLRFNTSVISDYATIDSVKYKARLSSDNSTTDFFIKCIAAQDTLNPTYWLMSQFNKFEGWVAGANVYNPTIISDSLGTATMSVGDTLTFAFNVAGKGEISKTGITQFYILSGKDIGKVQNNTYDRVGLDHTSAYLLIYYTEAGLKYGGATLSTVGGAVLSKLGGAP